MFIPGRITLLKDKIMWKPDSLRFDPEQAAVVLNDADDIIAAEGIWKFVTLAGGDTVRVPDTENGQLFAAAPELLEALEGLMTLLENVWDILPEYVSGGPDAVNAAADKAIVAIANACRD